MRQERSYTKLSLLCLVLGAACYLYWQGWIIIRYPGSSVSTSKLQPAVTKKSVKLLFWYQDTWRTETTDVLWADTVDLTAYHLISQWLSLLDDEGLLDNKVTLQSALVSASGTELFLSFDRNPLPQEGSMFEKLMFIEGMLKTLRENNVRILGVRFLVQHKPMMDEHLDFSNAWPIRGFAS